MKHLIPFLMLLIAAPCFGEDPPEPEPPGTVVAIQLLESQITDMRKELRQRNAEIEILKWTISNICDEMNALRDQLEFYADPDRMPWHEDNLEHERNISY